MSQGVHADELEVVEGEWCEVADEGKVLTKLSVGLLAAVNDVLNIRLVLGVVLEVRQPGDRGR